MKLTKGEIMLAINDDNWQIIRKSMLGKSLDDKFITMFEYLSANNFNYKSQVQIMNYYNALKRGGLIKC